jgi:hypothetical protein
MAVAPKTSMTVALTGQKDFNIPFEYLARKFVRVTLIGINRKELVLNTDYRFTQRTVITTNKAWGTADGYTLLEIRRYTSASERLVDFSDGSILRAYDLNTSQVQSLHIAEEGRDIATDTIGVDNNGQLDARARRIVNLGDAIDPSDAVTLRQEQAWGASALNQANRSQTEANRSQSEADRSLAQANISTTKAAASQASAVASEASRQVSDTKAAFATTEANRATTQANLATTNGAAQVALAAAQVTLATTQAQLATTNGQTQVALAVTQANLAIAASTVAQNQVPLATAQADRAKTEADRAATEASKLGSFNDLAAALKPVTALEVSFNRGLAADAYVLAKDGRLIARGNGVDFNSWSQLQFQNPNGTERSTYLTDASGTHYFRTAPAAAGSYHTQLSIAQATFNQAAVVMAGTLKTGGNATVGAATFGTNGDVLGTIWGNQWLSQVVLTTSNWRSNLANLRVNELGSYCQAIYLPNAQISFNNGTPGGNLYASSSQGGHFSQTLVGSWYCAGAITAQLHNTIWQRYA